jgi:hypothetical protein
LHVHLLDPATVDEVVDVAAAQGNRQGVVDVGDGHAQGAGRSSSMVSWYCGSSFRPFGRTR